MTELNLVKQIQQICYIPIIGNRIPRRNTTTDPNMYTMKYPPPNTMMMLKIGWSFLNLVADLFAFVT